MTTTDHLLVYDAVYGVICRCGYSSTYSPLTRHLLDVGRDEGRQKGYDSGYEIGYRDGQADATTIIKGELGTLDSLRGSQATLDLDFIEATARAATPGRWHEFDGCVWTDVAECLHHGPSTAADREHVATMDPSTTLALVARVRGAEARLAAVDALHQPDLDWPHSSHENPEVECFRCEYCACRWRRPCPTHLAVHPECADGCQHVGGAQ